MKFLLPVDGSDYTKRMLAYLATHEELLAHPTEYIVLTVVTSIPAHAARHLPADVLENYYFDEAESVLAPVRSFAAMHGWPLRECTLRDSPAEAIAQLADREQADLIVMGSHGHTALGNILLGSVAAGVLARCRIPVLLIR